MDDLPEGDAWVSLPRHAQQSITETRTKPNQTTKLLKKVISIDAKDDEVFFQTGNCVLFTNEMAVPQRGFETTGAIDRQAFGGKTPRSNRPEVSEESSSSCTVDATEIKEDSSSSSFMISLFSLLLFLLHLLEV